MTTFWKYERLVVDVVIITQTLLLAAALWRFW